MKDGRGLMTEKRKGAKRSSTLVSKVMELEKRIDPLMFFSNNYFDKGERFLWGNASGEIKIIGLGICEKIVANDTTNAFSYVEQEWMKMLKNQLIDNPFLDMAVGPTLFGGFAFDPLKEKTLLWEEFMNATFFVPEFMLTEINGKQYITTNIFEPVTDKDLAIFQLEEKIKSFISKMTTSDEKKQNRIVKTVIKEEESWKETVRNVVAKLQDPLKKVVLARECDVLFENKIETVSVLRNLIQEQKNSYIFALENENKCFLGASPERLMMKAGADVYSACVAGSIKRGKTTEEDGNLEKQLLSDEKNLKEHGYVVQMIRSAMEQVCTNVELSSHPQVIKLRDIQHLYTPVKGKALANVSLVSLLELLHPTPALGGYPKDLALEIIREEENLDRGFYGAPIGWMDYNGNGEFAVSIRSGVIHEKMATLYAGCGIVAGSDVDSEFMETTIKFRPMLSALGGCGK